MNLKIRTIIDKLYSLINEQNMPTIQITKEQILLIIAYIEELEFEKEHLEEEIENIKQDIESNYRSITKQEMYEYGE